MARILSSRSKSKSKNGNPLTYAWEEFLSLDIFTRLFIITFLLIVLATPFIITNYQVFNSHGESESQRLKEIAQIQDFHQAFTGLSSSTAKVANSSIPSQQQTSSNPETSSNFLVNGINYLLRVFNSIFSHPK